MSSNEIVKNSFKKFVSIFNGSSFHINKNVSIFKTGINHWSMNFAFLENEIDEKDLIFLENKLDVPSIIFSDYDLIDALPNRNDILYLGEFPLMKKEEFPDFYKAPVYDDIEIISIKEYPLMFEDFVKTFESIRGINDGDIFNKINPDNLTKDSYFFVAYMGDKPVGTFYFISDDDNMFVIDSSVKESHKNTGVYSALLRYAKQEGISNEIFNYYSIFTSEFSIRAASNEGYKVISSYNIWKKSE